MTPVERTKYMDANEAKQLRTVTEARAITDMRHGRQQGILSWMVIDMALSTGLRVSELARITVEDIDLGRGMLKAYRSKKRKGKPEYMALNKELVDHLKEYLELTDIKTGPFFVGKRGPLKTRGLQAIFKEAVKRAGLPGEISIHSARHTLAVHLLKKTNNLRAVQKQLGHSSPATTANMYADISFEDMQQHLNGLYD